MHNGDFTRREALVPMVFLWYPTVYLMVHIGLDPYRASWWEFAALVCSIITGVLVMGSDGPFFAEPRERKPPPAPR